MRRRDWDLDACVRSGYNLCAESRLVCCKFLKRTLQPIQLYPVGEHFMHQRCCVFHYALSLEKGVVKRPIMIGLYEVSAGVYSRNRGR